MSQPTSQKIGHAIARGTAYATIGNMALRVIDAAVAVLLLVGLSVYSYGLYTLALASYSFWTVFFLPALQNVIVSDVSATKQSNPAQAHSLFSVYSYYLCIVGVSLWALFFFGSHHFAYWLDGHGEYLIAVSWLFLLAPFETIFGVKAAIMLDFGWVLAFRVIRSVSRLAMLVALTWFSALSVTYAIEAAALSLAIAIAATFFYKRETWLSWIGWSDIKLFWKHSIRTHGKWALAEDAFNSSTQSVQPFIIKYFLGAEAVALISLASNLLSYAKSALPIRDVLFPILPQTEDRAQLARYAGKLMKYATIAYVGITVAASIGAPIVTHLLIPKYAPALELFYILILSLPVFGIRSVAVPLFYTLKAQKALFFIIVSRTILGFVLLIGLIQLFGLTGAAASMTVVGIVTAISYLHEIRRQLPQLRISMKEIIQIDEVDMLILGQIKTYVGRKVRILFRQ